MTGLPPPDPRSRRADTASADGTERLALPANFRYVHEPLVRESAIPMLGCHSKIVDDLVDHLRYSDGGTFLVAGFRGVGKTTVVRRALARLAELDDEVDVVDISLDVARPVRTADLLFAVVRRLFERLTERGLFDRLAADVQRTLLVSYLRTSLQLGHSTTETRDRSGKLSLGGGDGVASAVLGNLLPKLELGASRSSALAVEASFLAYSDSDVEHDFLRMVDELRRGRRSAPERRGWRRAAPAANPRPVRLVVVLDELDKLTATPAGQESLDQILLGLKNVLTNGGAHFVLVAGPELYDRVLHDARHGSGAYESIFARRTYVPCVWCGARQLVDELVADRGATDTTDDLAAHLAYRSRGVPRRLLQSFNELTIWSDGRPYVELDDVERRRLALHRRFEEAIRRHLGIDDAGDTTTLDEDRRRLAAYLVTEWVTGSGGRVFDVADVAMHVTEGPLGRGVILDPVAIAELLSDLAEDGMLRVFDAEAPGVTHVGRVSSTTAYALSDHLLDELRALAGVPSGLLLARLGDVFPSAPAQQPKPWDTIGGHHPEPTIVPSIAPAPSPAQIASAPPPRSLPDRYELGRRIGAGATGSVYEAVDRVSGRNVAIKMIERFSALTDPVVRARFDREVALARRLRHPGLVETLDAVTRDEGHVGVVMELVSGPTLAEVARPAPAIVVRWGLELCETLQYLADQGVSRIDLKPSNIILRDGEHPVIVDLGIAKASGWSAHTITGTGELVGTPTYMAPEQFENTASVDIRADIYALGIILFELNGGDALRPPLDTLWASLRRTLEEDVPVDDLAVSPALKESLRRAVARDPDRRYARPADLAAELAAVPEAVR